VPLIPKSSLPEQVDEENQENSLTQVHLENDCYNGGGGGCDMGQNHNPTADSLQWAKLVFTSYHIIE